MCIPERHNNTDVLPCDVRTLLRCYNNVSIGDFHHKNLCCSQRDDRSNNRLFIVKVLVNINVALPRLRLFFDSNSPIVSIEGWTES